MTKSDQQAAKKPCFEKVGECLYRYSSNGVYYALLKQHGKQKRTSLETTDRAAAKRKLSDLKQSLGRTDTSAGRITLKELSKRFLATVASQSLRTRRRKADIVTKLLDDFQHGPDCQISKIRKSSLEAWLASYDFGYASYNLYLQCIKGMFDLAVHDKLIADSPALSIKGKKIIKPKRITPSFEEFQKIIINVRDQPHNADAIDSAYFLEFMGLAGTGQAEMGNLTRSDIDFKKGRIHLYRVKTSSPYEIALFPQLKPLLTQMKVEDMPHDQKLFVIKDGKKALSGACKRLGFPPYSQRSLRRMFITRCIELGIDVKVIADWQGHKDGGKLILGTYSHVRQPHHDSMAAKLTC